VSRKIFLPAKNRYPFTLPNVLPGLRRMNKVNPLMFIEVAINIPADKTFTYAVPADLQGEATVGMRVLVPFGKRSLTGVIVGVRRSADRQDTREILRILDRDPLFHAEDLRFYRWAADYYFTPLGKALGEILPGGIDIESHLWIALRVDAENVPPLHRKILDALGRSPSGMPLQRLKKEVEKKDLLTELRKLEKQGLVSLEERLKKPPIRGKTETIASRLETSAESVKLTERQKLCLTAIEANGGRTRVTGLEGIDNVLPVLRSLERKGLIRFSREEALRIPAGAAVIGRTDIPLRLNPEQQAALHAIVTGISSGSFSPFLLHGVTGSGKTEVYIRAIKRALEQGGRAIYLVPEIALTPQLIGRLESRFPAGEIAVLHSGISPAVRYDQWRKIERGGAKIIVGARSAIFAPAGSLRLIIVDEEHDPSYKQDERMPYNARDLAVVRAKQSNAAIVLGSATPGIQTRYNTLEKKFVNVTLTKRVEDRALPHVEIVDMKNERDANGRVRSLSRRLVEQVGRTLEAKRQSLLFLNRRGFNTYHYCGDCAHVFRCLNCAVSLTHHLSEGTLRCHYCDFSVKAPPVCPGCGGSRILSYGLGTEKLAGEIEGLFPQARIARMDSDTTSTRGSHERILQALGHGEIDILVGTQMITKGHDFPDVTLVGVVSADTTLNMPDFRAAERTFQLLTQVSGRSGRGDAAGTVIIQTLNPGHYAIERTRSHDFAGFYEDEITLRKDLGYPPFSRMVNLLISGTGRDKVEKGSLHLGRQARRLAAGKDFRDRLTVTGPMESPLAKVRGRYRWQLLVRGKQVRTLHTFIRRLLEETDMTGCEVRVDVDPMNFM
jgi:primosomal protein N' (replication factor Y)